MEDAVKGAAALAGLTDYRTVDYPEQKGFFEQLMADLNGQARTWVAEQTFGDDAALMKQFEKVREARRSIGVQARMPFDIEIH